jgi:hypothetical protein
MKKRNLFFASAICLVIAMTALLGWVAFPKSPSDAFGGGDGTAGNPWIISTAAELRSFRDMTVANTNGAQTAHVWLANNIDLQNVGWTPIQNFAGIFDGRGYMISGFNPTLTSNVRAFIMNLTGSIAQPAILRNLSISGTMTQTTGNVSGFATFVSRSDGNMRIYNCKSYVDINVSTASSSGQCVLGGIIAVVVGPNWYVYNNKNYGNVTHGGGFSGSSTWVGGIVGSVNSAAHNTFGIMNNINYGTVTTTSSASGAGLHARYEVGAGSIANTFYGVNYGQVIEQQAQNIMPSHRDPGFHAGRFGYGVATTQSSQTVRGFTARYETMETMQSQGFINTLNGIVLQHRGNTAIPADVRVNLGFYELGHVAGIGEVATLSPSGGIVVRYNRGHASATGNISDLIVVGESQTALSSNTFTREFHEFKGWAISAADATNGVVTFANNAPVTASNPHAVDGVLNLWAVWDIDPAFRSNFSFNGNTGTTDATPFSRFLGDVVTLSAFTATHPDPTNWTFMGWATTAEGTPIATYTALGGDENVTFFAIWRRNTLTATFIRNRHAADNESETQTFNTNQAQALPGALGFDMQHHIFKGWATTRDGTPLSNFDFGAGAQTFYAIWEADPEAVVSLSFNANGGTLDANAQAFTFFVGETEANLSTRFTARRDNHQFLGWATDAAGEVISSIVGSASNRNIVLFAIWQRDLVTPISNFSANGGTFVGGGSSFTQNFNTNETQGLPLPTFATTPTNKLFAGWALTSDATVGMTEFAFVNVGRNFFAVWVDDPAANVDVTYDTMGGTAVFPSGIIVMKGTGFALPNVGSTTLANHTLIGWARSPDGASVGAPGATFVMPAIDGNEMTLYALWQRNQVVATFNANGGAFADGGTTTRMFNTNELQALPTIIITAPEFKRFAGWALTIDGAIITQFNFGVSAQTFFAIWENEPDAQVSISFVVDAGINIITTEPTNMNLIPGQVIDLTLYTAEKDDHTFIGWSIDGDNIITSYVVQPGDADIEFIPIFTRNQIVATYRRNDGGAQTQQQNYNTNQGADLIALPAGWARDGFIFRGWSLTATGDVITSYSFGSVAVEFFAIWEQIRVVNVTFSASGGTGTKAAHDVNMEGNLVLPINTFERAGHAFGAWEIYVGGVRYGSAFGAGASIPMSAIVTNWVDGITIEIRAFWILQDTKDIKNPDVDPDTDGNGGTITVPVPDGETGDLRFQWSMIRNGQLTILTEEVYNVLRYTRLNDDVIYIVEVFLGEARILMLSHTVIGFNEHAQEPPNYLMFGLIIGGGLVAVGILLGVIISTTRKKSKKEARLAAQRAEFDRL